MMYSEIPVHVAKGRNSVLVTGIQLYQIIIRCLYPITIPSFIQYRIYIILVQLTAFHKLKANLQSILIGRIRMLDVKGLNNVPSYDILAAYDTIFDIIFQLRIERTLMKNYEVLSVIGEGAYGIVLKGRHLQTKKQVAIKKFNETNDEDLIKKITTREIGALRALKHTNIVDLEEAFVKKGRVYLIFEFLDNNLLEVLEKSRKGISQSKIALYMYQLLEGLAFMHQKNYIHRDIKPENLLVSRNERLKICDMGFTRKSALQSEKLTQYVATRWYRPPQLLLGAPYDSAVDIWGIGCIMAELIDGDPLFPGENDVHQLNLIRNHCGDLPQCFQQYKNNFKKGKQSSRKNTIENTLKLKYSRKMNDKGLHLIAMMLNMDPSLRITAAEALKHPFFQRKHKDKKDSLDMQELGIPRESIAVKVSEVASVTNRPEKSLKKENGLNLKSTLARFNKSFAQKKGWIFQKKNNTEEFGGFNEEKENSVLHHGKAEISKGKNLFMKNHQKKKSQRMNKILSQTPPLKESRSTPPKSNSLLKSFMFGNLTSYKAFA